MIYWPVLLGWLLVAAVLYVGIYAVISCLAREFRRMVKEEIDHSLEERGIRKKREAAN